MDGEVKMEGIFDRTALLLGDEAMERLRKSHVAVFGVGGVGGYIVEALARSGIGEITVVAIIPTGLNVPKSFNPIGAVIICAPVEDANEDEINEGKIFEYIL